MNRVVNSGRATLDTCILGTKSVFAGTEESERENIQMHIIGSQHRNFEIHVSTRNWQE
jgi:hypothetical protein